MRSLLVLLWLLLQVGCSSSETPDLVGVSAVTPTVLEPGDTLELFGNGFPPGRPATVTLAGTLHRAGAASGESRTLTFSGIPTSSGRLEVVFDQARESEVCGEEAMHTTFRGTATVAFAPRLPGAPPISGRLAGLVLEIFPGRLAPEAAAQQKRESDRLLTFLGIEVTGSGPSLTVGRVEPGSRAEAAGILPLDRIVGVGEITAMVPRDLVPSLGQRKLRLTLRRGEGAPHGLELSVEGFHRSLPVEYGWAFGLVIALSGVLILASTRIFPFIYHLRAAEQFGKERAESPSGTTRKTSFADQSWKRAAPFALVSFGVAVAYPIAFVSSPSATGAAAVLFLGVALGRILVGFAAGGTAMGRFGLRSAFRQALRAGAVEWCAAIAMVAAVLDTGTLGVPGLGAAQGPAPWSWLGARSPVGFAAMVLFLGGTLIDFTGSGRELALSKRSSIELALLDWALISLRAAQGVGLFFGAAELPFEAGAGGSAVGLAVGLYAWKVGVLLLLVAFLRRFLGRPQLGDHGVSFWKLLLEIHLGGGLLASLILISNRISSAGREPGGLLLWALEAVGSGWFAALTLSLFAIAFSSLSGGARRREVNPWF